jgi:hypothetical protein
VTPSARADAGHLTRLRRDVVDDVVWTVGVTTHSARHEIEIQVVTRPPAMLWSAHDESPLTPTPPTIFPLALYSARPPPNTFTTADPKAHHRIVALSVVRRVATVRDGGAHGIALLKAEEAAARLRGGVEVRGG